MSGHKHRVEASQKENPVATPRRLVTAENPGDVEAALNHKHCRSDKRRLIVLVLGRRFLNWKAEEGIKTMALLPSKQP